MKQSSCCVCFVLIKSAVSYSIIPKREINNTVCLYVLSIEFAHTYAVKEKEGFDDLSAKKHISYFYRIKADLYFF